MGCGPNGAQAYAVNTEYAVVVVTKWFGFGDSGDSAGDPGGAGREDGDGSSRGGGGLLVTMKVVVVVLLVVEELAVAGDGGRGSGDGWR